VDSGKAPLKELAEAGVEFHEEKPPWRDAARQKRLRDRAGARAQLDNGSRFARIDVTRHHARQKAPRWGDRAGNCWIVEPRSEEARLVGNPLLDRRVGL